MWKTVKLGEICDVRRGTTITKKQTFDGNVPVIGGGTKPTYYHNKANRAENCITISGSGASAGFVNMWDKPIFASDCSTVESKDGTQLSKFIYYYLCSQQEYIYANFRSGAAQPHVYAKDIATLNYPVLPFAEQQLIVTKLDAALAKIDKAIDASVAQEAAVVSAYDAKVSAVLSQLLSDNNNEKLQNLCKRITVGYVGKMTNQYVDNGIKFLRSQSIRPYEISEKGLLYISEEFNKKIEKSQLKINDVCVVRTGYPGTAAMVTEKWEGANCSDLVIFTPGRKLYPEFLVLFFNSKFGKNMVLGKVVGAAQKHFNVTTAKHVDFPCVDMDEQKNIIKKTNSLRERCENLALIYKQKQNELIQLKKAILMQELQGVVA